MLGFEFVEQVAKLVVMETLLDGLGHVAAETASAGAGTDGLSKFPRQGDADFFHLAVQARLRSGVRLGTTRRQDCYDTLEHLLTRVGLKSVSHRLLKRAERGRGLGQEVVICGSSHAVMLPPVAIVPERGPPTGGSLRT